MTMRALLPALLVFLAAAPAAANGRVKAVGVPTEQIEAATGVNILSRLGRGEEADS